MQFVTALWSSLSFDISFVMIFWVWEQQKGSIEIIYISRLIWVIICKKCTQKNGWTSCKKIHKGNVWMSVRACVCILEIKKALLKFITTSCHWIKSRKILRLCYLLSKPSVISVVKPDYSINYRYSFPFLISWIS